MLASTMGLFQEQSLETDSLCCFSARSCLGALVYRAHPACVPPALTLLLVPRPPSLLLSLPVGSFPLLHNHSNQADSSSPFAPLSLLWTPGKALCKQQVWDPCVALQSSLEDVSASQVHRQTLAVTVVLPQPGLHLTRSAFLQHLKSSCTWPCLCDCLHVWGCRSN